MQPGQAGPLCQSPPTFGSDCLPQVGSGGEGGLLRGPGGCLPPGRTLPAPLGGSHTQTLVLDSRGLGPGRLSAPLGLRVPGYPSTPCRPHESSVAAGVLLLLCVACGVGSVCPLSWPWDPPSLGRAGTAGPLGASTGQEAGTWWLDPPGQSLSPGLAVLVLGRLPPSAGPRALRAGWSGWWPRPCWTPRWVSATGLGPRPAPCPVQCQPQGHRPPSCSLDADPGLSPGATSQAPLAGRLGPCAPWAPSSARQRALPRGGFPGLGNLSGPRSWASAPRVSPARPRGRVAVAGKHVLPMLTPAATSSPPPACASAASSGHPVGAGTSGDKGPLFGGFGVQPRSPA